MRRNASLWPDGSILEGAIAKTVVVSRFPWKPSFENSGTLINDHCAGDKILHIYDTIFGLFY